MRIDDDLPSPFQHSDGMHIFLRTSLNTRNSQHPEHAMDASQNNHKYNHNDQNSVTMRLLRAGQRSILGVGLLSLIMAILVHKEYIDLRVSSDSRRSGILTGSELEAIRAEALSYPSYHPPKKSLNNFTYMKREYISKIPVPYETIVDDPWASPYEIRWPGFHLPKWAHKVGAGGASWKEVPQGKHICYCSVGKAAGSSVSGLLGFQLHRPDVYFIPQGLLAHYTTQIFHGTINNCADDTPYYLFTMRHPLSRLQSAFRYDRDTYGGRDDKYNAVIYKTCKFKTLNILAVHGLSADGKASKECKHLAYDLVRGSGFDYSYHMFSNYHYYLNVSFAHHNTRDPAESSSSKLLAIRSEHMEEDWNSAERAVRMGDEDDGDGEYKKENTPTIELNIPHLNVKTDTVYQDQLLSTKAQVLLCEALCREIQTYKDILRRAVNLNRQDYLQSMKELQDSCPLQVHSEDCPEDDLDAYYSRTRPTKREKKG